MNIDFFVVFSGRNGNDNNYLKRTLLEWSEFLMDEEIQIKAISVKQPWANMIASGKKTIETRTWKTSYRGPILIVSSRKPPIEPAGYALAIADLVDCRPMVKADETKACIDLYAGACSWILENIRLVTPFPVKGTLGIYDVIIKSELPITGS